MQLRLIYTIILSLIITTSVHIQFIKNVSQIVPQNEGGFYEQPEDFSFVEGDDYNYLYMKGYWVDDSYDFNGSIIDLTPNSKIYRSRSQNSSCYARTNKRYEYTWYPKPM